MKYCCVKGMHCLQKCILVFKKLHLLRKEVRFYKQNDPIIGI